MAKDIIKTEMITVKKLIEELGSLDSTYEVSCSIVIDEVSFMPVMVMTLPMKAQK